MPDLDPNLHEEIVKLLLPRREFLQANGRIDLLRPLLEDWPGHHKINWDGSPYLFFNHLVRLVPGPQLLRVLRQGIQGGVDVEAEVDALCARLEAALAASAARPPSPLTPYYDALKQELSSGRWQLDSRFVKLTLLIDQGREAQGLRFIPDGQRGRYTSLRTLLGEVDDRALVVLGGPGSGKTTLLRRLQLEQVWANLGGGADDGDAPAAGGPIPFFVPLNAYRGARLADSPPGPLEWLAERWQRQQPDLPDFASLLRGGRLLLLLDGLNELPHRDRADYGERVAAWRLFLQGLPPGNVALFSCRSLDYSVPLDSEARAVRQIQVEPLPSTQIQEFLNLYLADAADEVWAALRQDREQLALFATPFFLRLLVDQKLATGDLLTSRIALLTGFVRRALHREAVQKQQRLFRPGALLTERDVQQVTHNRWAAPTALPQQGALIPRLERLAFAMQDGRMVDEAGQVRVAEETALALLDHPQAADMLAAGVQLNVLDRDLTKLEVTYLHQLLQEYFAARVLARDPDPERARTAWRADEIEPDLETWRQQADVSTPLPAAPTTGWEETTVLAAAMAADPAQVVADLMAANLPLAARCAAGPELVDKMPAQLVADLQTALLARIGDAEADLRARIAAAEALGELGDPRFERRTGPHSDYLRPPTVAVPGGTYVIGDDDSQYDNEKPAHPVEIAPFEMAVFPVTNAEYRLFIDAGGYEDERWWQTAAARAWLRGESSNEGQLAVFREQREQLQVVSDEDIRNFASVTPEQVEAYLWLKHAADDELAAQVNEWYPQGEKYRQPDYWGDSRFNHPAQPVVGVCWFEARAYCAWLSAQTGDTCALPTEAEWEAAAAGREKRPYAYGRAYDNGRCNAFETQVRRTTPVGVFPEGHTPAGVADLSGNVWEWTTSQYRPYPYVASDGREDAAAAEPRRVLRGGSWGNGRDFARASCRSSLTPDARNYDVGFRVVVRLSPSHLGS